MRRAVGLQPNSIARKPRALPWAGMRQAMGLIALDSTVDRAYPPAQRGRLKVGGTAD